MFGSETLFDAVHFPTKGIEDRSESEILAAAYRRRHYRIGTMRSGVCPDYGGVVERALESSASLTDDSGSLNDMAGLDTYASLACGDCKTSLVGHPTNVTVTTPTVVGFFADYQRDVARSRWWDGPIATGRDCIEVVDEDPGSVGMAFEIDGDRVRIVFEASLQVVDAERGGEDGASS